MKKVFFLLLIVIAPSLVYSQSLKEQKVKQDANSQDLSSLSLEIANNGTTVGCGYSYYTFYNGKVYEFGSSPAPYGDWNSKSAAQNIKFAIERDKYSEGYAVTTYKKSANSISFVNKQFSNEYDLAGNKFYMKRIGGTEIQEWNCKKFKENKSTI